MTSGNWIAKSVATGNVVTVSAFHTFVFNGKNQIHEVRDYFDASGVMAAAMKTELNADLILFKALVQKGLFMSSIQFDIFDL